MCFVIAKVSFHSKSFFILFHCVFFPFVNISSSLLIAVAVSHLLIDQSSLLRESGLCRCPFDKTAEAAARTEGAPQPLMPMLPTGFPCAVAAPFMGNVPKKLPGWFEPWSDVVPIVGESPDPDVLAVGGSSKIAAGRTVCGLAKGWVDPGGALAPRRRSAVSALQVLYSDAASNWQ